MTGKLFRLLSIFLFLTTFFQNFAQRVNADFGEITNPEMINKYSSNSVAFTDDLIFADDFSENQGWIDQSDSFLFRDLSNQWLSYSTNRGSTRRWLMPISMNTDNFRLDFRFNVTSNSGNGKMIVGIVETLDNVEPWPGVGSSGYFAHLSQSQIDFFEKYDDETLVYHSDALGYAQNNWYQASIEINGGSWTMSFYANTGSLLGTQNGLLSDSHSGYTYIFLGLDNLSGWETQTGFLDDLYLFGSSSGRATWVWDSYKILREEDNARQDLFDFLQSPFGHPENKIYTIYIHITEDDLNNLPNTVRDFLTEAAGHNIDVHYLSPGQEGSDPSYLWVTNSDLLTHGADLIKKVIEFNENGTTDAERFKGIHLDIEPETLFDKI